MSGKHNYTVKRIQFSRNYHVRKSVDGVDDSLFRLSKFEALVTLSASAAAFTLAAYWTVLLSVDGSEGSFVAHPLIRGYCSPPFQLYGLICREWIVNSVSTTVWNIALLVVAAVFLLLAAIWRRALLAILIGLFIMCLLLPSKLSIWPICLVLLLVAFSGRRMRKLTSSHVP